MEKKLYVIMGDLFSSRHIKDSEVLQKKLEKSLKKINSNYANDIYAKFKILKGVDEIGGALLNIQHVYEIINSLLDEISPDLMRFVLVLDNIEDPSETKDVVKMSGTAFHKASDIMKKLKKSDLIVDISLHNRSLDKILTDIINLIISIKKDWSATKRQIFKEYKKTGNQYKVAEKLGITQQAVSKNLDYINWREMKEMENSLNDLLKIIILEHKRKGLC